MYESCILILHGYTSRVELVNTGFIVLSSLNPFLGELVYSLMDGQIK